MHIPRENTEGMLPWSFIPYLICAPELGGWRVSSGDFSPNSSGLVVAERYLLLLGTIKEGTFL